jgi:hypothetical protein
MLLGRALIFPWEENDAEQKVGIESNGWREPSQWMRLQKTSFILGRKTALNQTLNG